MNIHLGYEIPGGGPVQIPLRHMAVTGQTQESGKTTTLEALITRSGLRAIAFITKRGESGFESGRRIAPFFQERADWEFIESILESVLKQRMKFERAWVVRASKGASTLAEVQSNVSRLMQSSKRSMDADMYMLLNEYLGKVVPLVQRLPKAEGISLGPALNVMDLLDYPEELQMLVVASTLRWIHAHEQNVVTLIPEAWKFIPQGRKTPVKIEVERLAREGAGLKNYIWIDSQDMAGVEKIVLRAASVWLIGVQREMNELKRALGNIPAGIKRPRPEEVAQLGIGEFYACWHKHIHKVYVQPAWMDENSARAVAIGYRSTSEFLRIQSKGDDAVYKEKYEASERERARLEADVRRLEEMVQRLQQGAVPSAASMETPGAASNNGSPPTADLEAIFNYVRGRIIKDPVLLRLTVTNPEIEVQISRETVTLDGKTLRGKLAELIAKHFFDNPTTGNAAFNELKRLGFPTAKPNVYRELDKLTTMGFLTKEESGYQAVPDMKVRIIEARA